MHTLNAITVLVVLSLWGVEFSVSAFVNPIAWRLEDGSQLKFLSQYAALLGRVMPFWYSASILLLGTETWLHRHTSSFAFLLTACALWLLASLASFALLVPLNNRIAAGAPDWQSLHRTWDSRHRVRILALALGSVLLTYAVVA